MLNRKLLFIGVLLMLLSVLVGCANNQEKQIKEDYLAFKHTQGETEMTIDDVVILNNYGTYNGAVVVRIKRGAFQVITTIEIDSIEFIFSDSNTPLVWSDGQFFELIDAYDENLLTKDDLVSLAKKINK